MLRKIYDLFARKDVSAALGALFGAIFMVYPPENAQLIKIGFSMGSSFSWPYFAVLIVLSVIVADAVVFQRKSTSVLWFRFSPILKTMTIKGIYFLYGMIAVAAIAYNPTGSLYAIGLALNLMIICGMLHFYKWSFEGFDQVLGHIA